MQNLNQNLDSLFAAYREACPDSEPGDRFMPGLWNKIEARQSSVILLTRWSKIFVTAAAAITLLMSVVLIPHVQSREVYSSSYIDVLSADHTYDNALSAELVRADFPQEAPVN
ncbi:MAG TPA: hypothetical protein VKV15_18920 [Bryobacteraceae bacterium]|nr:hypothetical protein [Bryobacteraceae bacterium]